MQSAISSSLENCASNCVSLIKSQKILRWQSEQTIRRGVLSAERLRLRRRRLQGLGLDQTASQDSSRRKAKEDRRRAWRHGHHPQCSVCQKRLFDTLDGVKLTCNGTHCLCLNDAKATLRTEGEHPKCPLSIVPMHQEFVQREHAFAVENIIQWKIRQDGTEHCLVKGAGLRA
jgi:hypothetical protein